MKKIILSLLFLLTVTVVWAQVPQQISYQSVIRDGNNKVIASSTVGIKISLLQGSATGTAVYVETHQKTTNANGLVSLEIGTGTVLSGSFASINWANGPYLVKTETDPTGGVNYSAPGVFALNSVPYALYAANGTPGPKGDKGDTGATGAKGDTGAAGPAPAGTGLVTVNNGSLQTPGALTGDVTTSGGGLATTIGTGKVTNNMLAGSIDLTSKVTGALPVANGGTGLSSTPANGQLDIGNGSGFTRATLTAGTGITITNASGAITIASSAGSAGVPYTGATGAVNLGGYDLTVNELTFGSGKVGNSGSNSNTIVGGAGVSRTFTSVLSNTAIGYNTMSSAIPGNNNTAVGAYSLVSTTGGENSVLGAAALERNLGGNGNTAIGYYSLRNNTAGANNTALGHNSLIIDPPGSNNTIIGASADLGVSNLTNATAIGYQAKVAASNTIQLGADGTNSTTAITNVKTSGTLTAGTVTYPNAHNSTTGQVLTISNTGTASWASASSSSGVPYTGATQAVNLGIYDLTVNGMTIGSGKVGASATLSTIVGEYALNRTNRGTDNTAIGYKSMGNETSQNVSTGTKNTAVGSWTLVSSTGTENTAVGVAAMEGNQGGSYNTAIGNNTLSSNTTGTYNTAIGKGANVGNNNLTNATAIGNGAIAASSNTIQLGNTAVTTIGGQVAWTAASDIRIKKNIINSNYGLATVLQLRPVEYNLTSNDLKQVGFIAQEVQKLVPEVITGKEGDLSKGEILGITYSNLIPVLTKAIQEQQQLIESQQKQLEELQSYKNSISSLQKELEEIKKLLKGQEK